MPPERPFGILIIAAVLTFWGGVTSFILIVEIIDSIRFYGFESLLVTSLVGLVGFILYAALPVLVYWTGIGVFEAKRWSYVSVTRWIPVLMACFLLNFTYNAIKSKTGELYLTFGEIFFRHFDDFFKMLAGYFITCAPLLYYLRQNTVRSYFTE